jgi:hypothetical protein
MAASRYFSQGGSRLEIHLRRTFHAVLWCLSAQAVLHSVIELGLIDKAVSVTVEKLEKAWKERVTGQLGDQLKLGGRQLVGPV